MQRWPRRSLVSNGSGHNRSIDPPSSCRSSDAILSIGTSTRCSYSLRSARPRVPSANGADRRCIAIGENDSGGRRIVAVSRSAVCANSLVDSARLRPDWPAWLTSVSHLSSWRLLRVLSIVVVVASGVRDAFVRRRGPRVDKLRYRSLVIRSPAI